MFFPPIDGSRHVVEERPPSKTFARIDTVEDLVEEDQIVLLDAVDNWWFESDEGDVPLADRNWPANGQSPLNRALSTISIDGHALRDGIGEFEEGDWITLHFGHPDEAERPADQFLSLFSDPTPRGVISIERMDDAAKTRLEKLAGWGEANDADPDEIGRVLDRQRRLDTVAIYDVGQGAATALLADGKPALYFDFGGAANGNWRTFPKRVRRFCFEDDPPIVLSHWDWDHWSSALRDHRALDQTWVLPLQETSGSLGLVHAAFLSMLRSRAQQTLWWPRSLLAIQFKHMNACLIKAQGRAKSRNETGLALVVGGEVYDQCSVLLPADASFGALKGLDRCSFDHIVVPHHGGRTDLAKVPKPRSKRAGHAVYSYGVGNIFLHPLTETQRTLRKTWKNADHTAFRQRFGLGHVGIDLVGRKKLPFSSRCQNCNLGRKHACDLAIQHWIP
ncbi:MAG: hypothetical protein F4X97_09765 [Boseongicola sp. SB0662_bin_57]|nr:hypothetical protein [Boseongicola sp. SB0662_bin_57]